MRTYSSPTEPSKGECFNNDERSLWVWRQLLLPGKDIKIVDLTLRDDAQKAVKDGKMALR